MTNFVKKLTHFLKIERLRLKQPTKDKLEDTEDIEDAEHMGQDFIIQSMSKDFDIVVSSATFAMAAFLKGGQILLEHYVIEDFLIERDVKGKKMKAGKDPMIDRLVMGKWKEEDILVFVGVRFSLMTMDECRCTISEVKDYMAYWEFLVKEGQEQTNPYVKTNFHNMNITKHGKWKLMIAFAAKRLAEESPWNLHELHNWFRIQLNPTSKSIVSFQE